MGGNGFSWACLRQTLFPFDSSCGEGAVLGRLAFAVFALRRIVRLVGDSSDLTGDVCPESERCFRLVLMCETENGRVPFGLGRSWLTHRTARASTSIHDFANAQSGSFCSFIDLTLCCRAFRTTADVRSARCFGISWR